MLSDFHVTESAWLDQLYLHIFICLAGPLLQVFTERSKAGRGRLPSIGAYPFRDTKKEEVRQVFLFTNHMLLTTRAKENGRLHLAKVGGLLFFVCLFMSL